MADFKGCLGRAASGSGAVRSGPPRGRGPSRAVVAAFALLAAGCGSLLGIEDVGHDAGENEGFGGTGGTSLPGEGGRGGTKGGGGSGPIAGRGGGGGVGGGAGSGGDGTFGAGGGEQGAGGGEQGAGGSEQGAGGVGGAGGGEQGAGGGAGTGGAGGGKDTCPLEPSDDNDTMGGATKLASVGSCNGKQAQSVLRKNEIDWFRLHFDDIDVCEVTASAAFTGPPGSTAEVCTFVRPDFFDISMQLFCPPGFTPSSAAGPDFTGCCGINRADVGYNYDGLVDGSALVLIRVSALTSEPFCVPYSLAYGM